MSKWFNYNGVKGLKATFNYIESDRRDGKTTSVKVEALRNHLKDGLYSVYIRRYKTEFSPLMKQCFYDEVLSIDCYKKEFGHLFTVNSKGKYDNFKVDSWGWQFKQKDGTWKYFLIFVPLSIGGKTKSTFNARECRCLEFDEYQPLDGRYLKNEMKLLMEMHRSFDAKTGRIPVLNIYSNTVSLINPFFQFYGIRKTSLKSGVRTYKNGKVAVITYKAEGDSEYLSNTGLNELYEGTEYESYANGGFLFEANQIIEKIPSRATLLYAFKSSLGKGTIWHTEDIFFVSQRIRDTYMTLTDKPYADLTEQTTIDNAMYRQLYRNLYQMGKLKFDSEFAMKAFQPLLKLLNIDRQ